MSLYFESHGIGKPLILIPGFASGAWSWFCQIEDLAKKFQVITFDPRGIGKSKGDLQNLSLKTFVEDILSILDELEIEKANVLGASFGGFVAQEFALRYPKRLGKLILSCTSIGGANHIKPDIEVLRSFSPSPNLTIGEHIRKFIRPAFSEKFNQKQADLVEKVCLMRETNEVADEVYQAQLETAFSFNSESWIQKIMAKTLVITGDNDRIVPMQNSLNLAEKLPNSTLKIINRGSHLIFIENAEFFNKSVRDFLEN